MASTVKLFLGFVFMLLSFIPVHVDHFISCQNSDNFNVMNYFPSNTELQNFRYIPNVKGNNSPLFLRDMLQHYSNTDSNNLFLYKEKPPLVVFSVGIGRPQGSKYLQLRFLSFYLCFYLVLALDKSLNIYMFQRQLLCRKFAAV